MAQVVLGQLVQGMKFMGQPVHATLFPYPIAATVHAGRISLIYQSNAASTGAKLPWGTYIVGYLIMTWGGTLWTHHLLNIPPPMLYSPTPYAIYLTTHLFLTLLTSLSPHLLSPAFLALLDTILFPLDALVRTSAITNTTAHLSPASSSPVAAPLKSSILTHLLIGALASAGGGLTASTLSTWSPSWTLSTPPILRAPTPFSTMDVWAGALVAAVHATLSGHPAFYGVRETCARLLRNVPHVAGEKLGVPLMRDLEARAVAAGVLAVCFGLRAYRTHWAGKIVKRMKSATVKKNQ